MPQASCDGAGLEQEQQHQCIALRRLINCGSQVLNTLRTQGLSELVCLSAFLHTDDRPRSIFIYIAYCLESYKSVTDKYATSSKIINSSFQTGNLQIAKLGFNIRILFFHVTLAASLFLAPDDTVCVGIEL